MIKTTALLLQSRKYREKDKLLHFYTLEQGKIMALCKSARTPLHRWACATEPPAFACIQLYEKNGFYTVTEICSAESFLNDRQNIEYLMAWQFLAMVLDKYTPYAIPQISLFQRAQSLFFQWKSKKVSLNLSLYSFLLFFLSVQGHAQDWKHCSLCKGVLTDAPKLAYLDAQEGKVYCESCRPMHNPRLLALSTRLCDTLNSLSCISTTDIEQNTVDNCDWMDLDRIITTCYREQIDPYFISFSQMNYRGGYSTFFERNK
jgi:DNA repair protein RecO